MLKMEIGACKNENKKSNFISSDFVLLLICHIWMYNLTKNAKKKKNICVAICFGLR